MPEHGTEGKGDSTVGCKRHVEKSGARGAAGLKREVLR